MSTNHLCSFLTGSPIASMTRRNGGKHVCMKRRKNVQSHFVLSFSGNNKGWYARYTSILSSSKSVCLPLGSSLTRNHFRISCVQEQFPKSFPLVRSLLPLWKDGLLLVRCSVFVAVMSAVGVLVWYAQLKARSFVEVQLLPLVCSVLSEYIQREIDVGKVQSVSPLGFTIETCSIGTHREEFSCGEVSTVKIRIQPYASLRSGRIVINAFLSQPSILVSQREDFSWLGIPSPSEGGLPKRHSSEEGIDYRTRTRRFAREESYARRRSERVNAARAAAEMGYIVPQGSSDSLMVDVSKHNSGHFGLPLSSSSLNCINNSIHCRDNHKKDMGAEYSLKHGELEKSIWTGNYHCGINWPNIIQIFMKHRLKQVTFDGLSAASALTAKQRNLKRSAAAARAYFHNLDKGKSDESSAKGVDTPCGGCESAETHGNKLMDKPTYAKGFDVDKDSLKDCSMLDSTLETGECVSERRGYFDSDGFAHREFGTCIFMHQIVPCWPIDVLFGLFRFPFVGNLPFFNWFLEQVHKVKSNFGVEAEDIAAEIFEGVYQIHSKGIEKVLPITLESVFFKQGSLMLLGYGDQEPREILNANGYVKFQDHYNRVHVQLSGDCMGWRSDISCNAGQLTTHVFVDTKEQKWHANLKISSLFAPLFERILDIPVSLSQEELAVHMCMLATDTFPNVYGQVDVNGLSFQIFDSPSCFSDITGTLCFRGQRVFLHNAGGYFGDAPIEASGDFGINPDYGEFHLMCQVPSVEVNALMRSLKMRPLMFPLAGSITATFNCQGPLDAPLFVGSGNISRKGSYLVSDMPPSFSSEVVSKSTGAVAAFDRIPFSHVSANFTFNLDNNVADLYGIRATLLDGGEIRGAGNAWICPEVDWVLWFGCLHFDTGGVCHRRFDIKWAAPEANDSFADARGDIIISHGCLTICSSAVAFDLSTVIRTCYLDNYLWQEEHTQYRQNMHLTIEGIDLDLRMRGFELASLISSTPFNALRPLHLKATGKFKFQGKVARPNCLIDAKVPGSNGMTGLHIADNDKAILLGDISLSGIKINQLLLAPQLSGSLSISHEAVKIRNLPLDELELASLRGAIQRVSAQWLYYDKLEITSGHWNLDSFESFYFRLFMRSLQSDGFHAEGLDLLEINECNELTVNNPGGRELEMENANLNSRSSQFWQDNLIVVNWSSGSRAHLPPVK
ncbi:hypothetical protein HPP92_014706 [Vanilla planifolia]|uniref:Uncharacterized protein n=1 Tax=Vanilla planifolia TaxID=51239 RepID=A0A835QRH5_VANPL|nr:hypothetical protein HPP92_014706 [Vanilla planifolia]